MAKPYSSKLITGASQEKDLSALGKKCYKNADKNNRGLGPAGEYPKDWDENSVGKPTKSQS